MTNYQQEINTFKLMNAGLTSKNELLEQELELEQEKHRSNEEFYEQIVSEYDAQIAQLNQQILELKGKVISQNITLNSYREKIGEPIIIMGEEQDLYRGEQRDFILSLVKNYMESRPNQVYTRSYSICKSILKANPEVGVRRSLIEKIAKIFKNRKSLDRDAIEELDKLGIERVICESHQKLYFHGNDRYFVSVAKTPSDKKGLLNTFSDLLSVFF